MTVCTLLIPSAKIVPEPLQALGRIPAVIYPVNGRIVFDYIYGQYSGMCGKLKVMCCENAEEVIKTLEPYGDRVNIETLPELKDLGWTVYKGLAGESGTVIINFADTIMTDEINADGEDCFYYSEDYMSEAWTFFTMSEGDHGAFTSITDKKPCTSAEKGNLFIGVFRITRPEILRICLERAFSEPETSVGTFYQAIRDYNTLCPMRAVKASGWSDIGHADKYFSSRLEVSAREFNHITMDRARGILTKTSDNREKFIQEIKWYLKLPSELEYTHPRIFSFSTHYTKPYASMEYYAYHTVHELFLYGGLGFRQWKDIFSRIRSVIDDFRRFTVKGNDIRSSLEDMYLAKTLQRIDALRDNPNFSAFFTKNITVNGRKYPSLEGICDALRNCVPEVLCGISEFTIIHGDLCFTNIMTDPSLQFIKLIDPRGSFGSYDIYGDPDYDLAKILHSIDGKYDFIIKDMFSADYDLQNASVNYEVHARARDFDMQELFTEIFSPDMKRVKLIEALLFLSMIPLHGESLRHQAVMLGTGIELLGMTTDITKE